MRTTTQRVAVFFVFFFATFFLCALCAMQLIFDGNAHPVNMKRSVNCGLLYSCELCASYVCNQRNPTQRTAPRKPLPLKFLSRALCASARDCILLAFLASFAPLRDASVFFPCELASATLSSTHKNRFFQICPAVLVELFYSVFRNNR